MHFLRIIKRISPNSRRSVTCSYTGTEIKKFNTNQVLYTFRLLCLVSSLCYVIHACTAPTDSQTVDGTAPTGSQTVDGTAPTDSQTVDGTAPTDSQTVDGTAPTDSKIQAGPTGSSQSTWVKSHPFSHVENKKEKCHTAATKQYHTRSSGPVPPLSKRLCKGLNINDF